jgi:hypothetical protein
VTVFAAGAVMTVYGPTGTSTVRIESEGATTILGDGSSGGLAGALGTNRAPGQGPQLTPTASSTWSDSGQPAPGSTPSSGTLSPRPVPVLPLGPLLSLPDSALHVDDNVIRRSDGSRFVVKGANIFGLPHYGYPNPTTVDQGLRFETDQTYQQRTQIAAKMQSLGLNAVRLQVGSDTYNRQLYMSKTQYVQRIYDIVQAFKARGIYTMISDHDYTGSTTKLSSNYRDSFELFQAIINKVGPKEPYLIFNPFNEPSNNNDWAAWRTPNRETLRWLRQTAGFDGVVMLDTTGWSWNFSPTEAQSMMDYDGTLHADGDSNIVFSIHRYPNNNTSWTGDERTSYINNVLQYADRYPLLAGEHGWSLGGVGWDSSQPDGGSAWKRTTWLSQLLDYIVGTAVPNGWNGVFGWAWHWDFNSMTDGDRLTWNEHGQIFYDHYYSKLLGSV